MSERMVSFVEGRYAALDAALEHSASHANPFALAPALEPLLPWGGKASALICMGEGGALMGVWPLNIHKPSRLLRILRSPNVPLYDTDGTPMIAAGQERAVLEAMVTHLAADTTLPKTLLIQSLTAEGPVWEALQALSMQGVMRMTIIETWQRALLERDGADSGEAYVARCVSHKTRKAIRAKKRRLEEEGPLALVVHNNAEDIPAGFETFLTLEASGWKGEKRTALRHRPHDARYSLELVTALACAGRAFIGVLKAGDRPVAAGLFLRAAGEVNFWRTAYDDALSKHSPGLVLDVMVTDHLLRQDWFERLDSGADSAMDPAKLLWAQRRTMANVVIDCSGASLTGTSLAAAQRLRLWVKRKKKDLFSAARA
jgi:CelD/BcsL family acetyltransferase involved in cellulose biosynthesis